MKYEIQQRILTVTAESEAEVAILIAIKTIRFSKVTTDLLEPVDVTVANLKKPPLETL